MSVSVVTGGASGIGLGVALQFAADGHHVAILDQNRAAAEVDVANRDSRRPCPTCSPTVRVAS